MSESVKTKELSIRAVDGDGAADLVVVAPVAVTVAPAWFTVERGLYTLILAAALIARLLSLGAGTPLLPLEATQAWSAWLAAMNSSLTATTSMATTGAQSPLLYTVQRFLFWMTEGGSDGWARFFPALVGTALVLLPWVLRRQLGRGGALILAGLIAVDPWLLTFSRLGDGAILSVAGAFVLWAALLNWDRLSVTMLRLLAVTAALFVMSGPLAWLLLPPLALTAFLYRLTLPADNSERSRLIGLFAGTVLVVATGWLAYWEGWGVLSSSVSAALSYVGGNLGYPLLWPIMRLIVDQPFVFGAGVIGLVLLIQKMRSDEVDRRLAIVLLVWSVYGVALLALPGRNPVTLLILGLPLMVAAAWATRRLLRFCLHDTDWQDGSLIAVALGVLLVTSYFLIAGFLSAQILDMRILFFFMVMPLLVAFFVWWSGWLTTAQVTGLMVAAAFLLASLSSAWDLSLRSDLPRGNHLFSLATQQNVRLLAEDVAQLGAIRVGDPGEIDLFVVQVDPSLQSLVAWYLRFVDDLRFVDAFDPALYTANTLVVASRDATLTLPTAAVGSDYPLVNEWLPTTFETWQTRLRWALYRELRQLPAYTPVVLWVQED